MRSCVRFVANNTDWKRTLWLGWALMMPFLSCSCNCCRITFPGLPGGCLLPRGHYPGLCNQGAELCLLAGRLETNNTSTVDFLLNMVFTQRTLFVNSIIWLPWTGAAAGANPWTHGSNPLNKIKFVKPCALFETWQWGIAVLDVYCPTHESCISLEGLDAELSGPEQSRAIWKRGCQGVAVGPWVQLALAVHLAVHLAVGLQCAALQNHHLGLSEWENCYIGVSEKINI